MTERDPNAATLRTMNDSYGCTVVKRDHERTGHEVVIVQVDKHEPGPGHDYYGKQVWLHTPDPEGERYVFRQDNAGRWREVKLNPKTGRYVANDRGHGLVTGSRETYQNPSV